MQELQLHRIHDPSTSPDLIFKMVALIVPDIKYQDVHEQIPIMIW
jgi:hypothetical protein